MNRPKMSEELRGCYLRFKTKLKTVDRNLYKGGVKFQIILNFVHHVVSDITVRYEFHFFVLNT